MIKGNNIHHFINGQDMGVPRNWDDIEIAVDWYNENKDNPKISISELDFVLEANRHLQKRVLDGLNGGVGIFEGEPYSIVIGDITNPVHRFEGYLDFTDGMTVFGGEEITTSLKARKGADWLNDVADGFSFAYLKDQGVISNSDYTKVPYVINYVPDGMQLIMLSISLYMITKETIENIKNLGDTIADVTDAATPVIGTGIGFGAVAVIAYDIGNYILVILKAVAKILYIIAMVASIIKLINEVFKQLLPKKRYHLGMSFRKMLEKACQHLGLTFQSSILELEWVYIPDKGKKGGSSGETGHPTITSPLNTFGDIIRTLKMIFNADYIITNGVFIFERRDYFETDGSYVTPQVFNDQSRMLDQVKFNTDEMISNYNINWKFDTQDQNTLDDTEGMVYQAITSPINTINKEFVSIKNFSGINVPFSLGKEKRTLTDVEKIARKLGRVVDNLTGIFGNGTTFGTQIQQRIGSLLMTSDFITHGKIVVMSGSKLKNNQREILSAKNLWDNFHYINSFAEINGIHNQYWRYENLRIPMTLEEFSLILENNSGRTSDTNDVFFIESLKYSPSLRTATINYRIKRKYTNNLKIEYVQ